jgi:hypothetical protein
MAAMIASDGSAANLLVEVGGGLRSVGFAFKLGISHAVGSLRLGCTIPQMD